MAEELQNLLDKINENGIKKAQAERESILKDARAEADTIIRNAKDEAARLTAKATAEAEALRARSESSVRQAVRDLLLKLESEFRSRISAAVSGAAEGALTPEFMTRLIRELAASFADSPEAEITILAAVKDKAALDAALKSALADSLKTTPKVLADPELGGGFEVSFRSGELYFDFSKEAVTQMVAAYAGPRVAELLNGGKQE